MTSTIEARPGAARVFTAATSRQALRLAREALGEEALVLASQPVPGGFEIVAMAREPVAALVGTAAGAASPDGGVLQELHAMRALIEDRFGTLAWNDAQRREPVRGSLLRTMLQGGFSARLSQALLEKLPSGHDYAQGLAFVRSELARAVQVQDDEEAIFAAGGVYALVGPTGVGKTTTTAKLAARCVMRLGADQVALVTTDGYRIGAYEQLRIYGQILGVRVHAVKDPASFDAVLRELRDKHLVLIDTVGMSQKDRAVADQIAMFTAAARPVKRLLLLNAATHGDTLNEVVYAWQHAGDGNRLAGCIFTKMDEATSRGALLDTAIRHRLPVYYTSDGQKVPENLAVADREQLVQDALMAPARATLFACDPALDTGPATDAAVTAQADSDRLRERYDRLIRAMAHDAEEIAAAAADLERLGIEAADVQRLWVSGARGGCTVDDVLRDLLNLARQAAARQCDSHVLALAGRTTVECDAGDRVELQGCLLLSDRTGQPFAAPRQWLASQRSPRNAVRQIAWLGAQQLGRPVVHLLPFVPGPGELDMLQGAQWLARAPGSLRVIDARTDDAMALSRLGFVFGESVAGSFRGRPAAVALAESEVGLRLGDGTTTRLRAIARRTCDRGGAVLEQSYLLAQVAPQVPACEVARWHEWGASASACLRLTGKGLSLLGGMPELGAEAGMKRVLIAAQAATTAWRLLHACGEVPQRTVALLARLAGQGVRAGRSPSAAAVFSGLARLFELLDALAPAASQESR